MNNQYVYQLTSALAFIFLFLVACDSNSANEEEEIISGNVPAVFDKFNDDIQIFVDGNMVVIQSNGVPDHGSPYFGTTDTLYEAYNGDNTNFQLNPNRIIEQSYQFRIPLDPQAASVNEATPLGPIGVTVNGVPIYNQYAGPNNRPLTFEIDSFDQYNGHPQQTGQYHYHVEPVYLTDIYGPDALIGFLLDGFPVYGPEENGERVTNDDLDEFHGHFGATPDYPDGIYHYHITDADPYINGAGFYGSAGTVSF